MTEKICAVDLGMPTLLEAAGAEESAALCAELGLQFVELNMNLPEYADPVHMDREKLCALREKYGVYSRSTWTNGWTGAILILWCAMPIRKPCDARWNWRRRRRCPL